jgi:hypothetical protein
MNNFEELLVKNETYAKKFKDLKQKIKYYQLSSKNIKNIYILGALKQTISNININFDPKEGDIKAEEIDEYFFLINSLGIEKMIEISNQDIFLINLQTKFNREKTFNTLSFFRRQIKILKDYQETELKILKNLQTKTEEKIKKIV